MTLHKWHFKIGLVIFVPVLLYCFIASAYNIFLHFKEEEALDNFIKSHRLKELMVKKDKASAFIVSDILRKEFNINSKTWKYLKLESRPFFRTSALELLRIKEGYCGEGTRVLIRLLIKLGYNATRVDLYDLSLNNGHTLASVIVNGKEHFIDSINSPEKTNEVLRNNAANSACFQVIPYQEKYSVGTGRRVTENEPCNRITASYVIYSYEAIPLNKITNLFYKEILSFNLSRPGLPISYIAESYYLIKALTNGFFSIFTCSVVFCIYRFLKRL